MAAANRRRFLHLDIAWMLAVALVLVLLDALSYELFFILSLIGFLIITELMTPVRISPAWRRRVRWVVFAGLVGFAYIVVRQVLAILSVEVF
jgi:hypothetical protein